MAGFRNPEQLDVWKLSDQVALRVREVIDRPAFRSHPKLREQMEEAAEGPCSHIQEGFARYRPADNARFVRIAAGSLGELIRHLSRARARQLLTPAEHAEISTLTKRALGAAIGYINYLQTADAPHLPPKRRARRKQKGRNPRTPNRNPRTSNRNP
jgi:four helix bundle protein